LPPSPSSFCCAASMFCAASREITPPINGAG
jgi:hypothetical protein